MSFLRQALSLGWKYFLAFIAVSILLVFFSNYFSVSIPENLRGTLLSAKLAVVSLSIATMTFYYKIFWDAVEKLKSIADIKYVVDYHRSSFILLFGGALFVFLSLAVDMYSTFFEKSLYLVHVNLGLMFTGLVLLFVFLLVFLGRTLGEMQTLRNVSTTRGTVNPTENQ